MMKIQQQNLVLVNMANTQCSGSRYAHMHTTSLIQNTDDEQITRTITLPQGLQRTRDQSPPSLKLHTTLNQISAGDERITPRSTQTQHSIRPQLQPDARIDVPPAGTQQLPRQQPHILQGTDISHAGTRTQN
jgi:hypothetical protein